MINVSATSNLKPWNAVASIDRPGAISNGKEGHPTVLQNNNPTYLWETTVYTPNGEFDANTAIVYKDAYGSPLTRCDIDCYALCNQFSMTLASKEHSFHMDIPAGTNNVFNETVYPNTNYKLEYSTPCWLSRCDTTGPYEPTNPLDNWWACTYITAYHDGVSILNSTNVSVNLYGGYTCQFNNSAIYTGTGDPKPIWWLTEVAETAGTHHVAHAVNLQYPSYSSWIQCHPWIINVPHNGSSRGISTPQYTYTSTYLRPKHEISVHYGGNGSLPYYAITTPDVTYHYQDTIRTLGHNAFGNAPITHPHTAAAWSSSHYIPSTTKLITCAPLYVSLTPNATGGTSDRTMASDGWYQHSSKNVVTDRWWYWHLGSATWTHYVN